MTDVSKTPEKKQIRKKLISAALDTLERQGWTVARAKDVAGRVRSITKNGKTRLAAIRTTQDTWIAFPRDLKDTKWGTLSEVDVVVVASVDDPHNPKFANVHIIEAKEMRDRFDRAYAARRAADHDIQLGRGLWISLYQDEATSPVQLVGAGAGIANPPIARVPLDGNAPANEPVERSSTTRASGTTKEDILRQKTYKDQGVDLNRRVFYTLQEDKSLQAHRNTKAIALVINHLREKNLISDDEIDGLLFDCIW